MPLLYYWRPDNYRRDLNMGAGYHLNQASPRLHQVDIGNSLWAFTRHKDGRYVLAAELVVRAKTLNHPSFRYGRYRIWGDLRLSRYFSALGQPNMEPIIRALSCRAKARVLAQAFQGAAAVRPITYQDNAILAAAAVNLPEEPRARILPEEQLEATLLLGDEAAVERLIQMEPHGVAEQRAEYLYKKAPERSAALTRALHDLYRGRCQVCTWDPRDIYGESLCQGHHVQWLSRGGGDDLQNMVLVCPNHHTAIHRCDAVLDYETLWFDFGSHTERLQLDEHLTSTLFPSY